MNPNDPMGWWGDERARNAEINTFYDRHGVSGDREWCFYRALLEGLLYGPEHAVEVCV